MASKNRSSNSSKSKSNTRGRTSQKQSTVTQDDKLRIAGIAVFAFSVIFFCLAVIAGDGVWNFLHNVYVGIFGVFAACVF